ncbi:MAG: hypothetical protein PHE33_12365 [Bacteroidales bacterium]|nr:hypothetical protein [Bacteroidales bacterium]
MIIICGCILLNLVYFRNMILEELNLWGIVIREPGTIISDFIMGFFCILFFVKLLINRDLKHQKYFSHFFLFLGASSFIAALAHGLYLYSGVYLHKISWILSGFATYFLELGSSTLFENEKFKSRFVVFIKIQLAIYILFLFFYDGFIIVKLNFVLSMIGILTPIYFVDMMRNQIKHNLYIFLGIFLAIFPSVFHKVDFNFLYIFNMNDLSHFFLILCIFFVFLGLKERFFNPDGLTSKTTPR